MERPEIKEMLLELREDTLEKIAENMKMEIGHLQEAIADMYDLADDERERQFSILLCDRDREKISQIDEYLVHSIAVLHFVNIFLTYAVFSSKQRTMISPQGCCCSRH